MPALILYPAPRPTAWSRGRDLRSLNMVFIHQQAITTAEKRDITA
jgi:hypothetical protein